MPTDGNKQEKSVEMLKSEGIERAIKGETVKSIMLPEDLQIDFPNYVIDLSDMETINDFQMKSIDSLLHSQGDLPIYLNTKLGIVKIGKGKTEILDRLLALIVTSLLGPKCKLYKNYVPGEIPKVVSTKDICTMRMRI